MWHYPPPSTRYAEHDRGSILLDHKILVTGLYLANMIRTDLKKREMKDMSFRGCERC